MSSLAGRNRSLDVTSPLPPSKPPKFECLRPQEKGLENEVRLIQQRSLTSRERRALVVRLMSQRQLLKEFINTSWPNGHLQAGQNRIQFLLERSNQIGENTQTVPAKSREEAEDASGSNTFALEEQLRDFLAENLQLLEVGLQQWPTENGDAVEYPVENRPASRRVDILARDAKGLPVIIELKVSRGHERTIGQALYYRAKIKERLNQPDARIFIVANLISPELRAAASEIVGVKLFQ